MNTLFIDGDISINNNPICVYLSTQLSIVNTSIIIYSVNAKYIANYKESYIEMKKTDLGDAFLIANFARVGHCRKLHPFKIASILLLNVSLVNVII